ncbi:MAG TPA: hypothetical protein VMU84_11080 [Thermoanaerobaculia bacterium]|nr:hypothetical protein [Thermoanaerobaculia bacterium]
MDSTQPELLRNVTYTELRREEIGAKFIVRGAIPSATAHREFIVPFVAAADGAGFDRYTTEGVIVAESAGDVDFTLYPSGLTKRWHVDGPFFLGKAGSNPRNEYPLLVPIDAAVLMVSANDLDDRNVRWLYVMFAAAFAFELARRYGAWYGALLLVLPQIAIEGEGGLLSAYSDIPLGAFIACAFFELIDGESPLRFGMWTSFALLTKSEGLPLTMLLMLAGAFVFRRRVALAFTTYVPALITLLMWRARISLSDENDFATLIFALPEHLARFLASLGAMAGQFIAFRDWGLFWLVVLVAAILLARRREWRPLALAGFVIIPMMILYAAIFAVTDWDMRVLTGNLAPRLMTHLLGPAFVLLARVTGGAPRASAT